MITIDGVPPSSQVRATLDRRPYLLAFSRGKDSTAAWLALRDDGLDQHAIPYYCYFIPPDREGRLRSWEEESLAYAEDYFGRRIRRIPHVSLYRWLAYGVWQPPERRRTLEAARLPHPDYEQVLTLVRQQWGLPADTPMVSGVRAADSPLRRIHISTHGPVGRQTLAIWDWQKADVMDTIRSHGYQLPRDYDWFGRSWDGLDPRFLRPIARHAPADDLAHILDWFPLAESELHRG